MLVHTTQPLFQTLQTTRLSWAAILSGLALAGFHTSAGACSYHSDRISDLGNDTSVLGGLLSWPCSGWGPYIECTVFYQGGEKEIFPGPTLYGALFVQALQQTSTGEPEGFSAEAQRAGVGWEGGSYSATVTVWCAPPVLKLLGGRGMIFCNCQPLVRSAGINPRTWQLRRYVQLI